MKELQRILELWAEAKSSGEPAVLATVVKTRGSAYRLPGARLLLTQSGKRAGSVSGGCLEDDLTRKAWWLTENGPVVKRYDTTPEGEIASSFGLGCSGIIYVLLERLNLAENILLMIRKVRLERKPAAIAYVIHPRELVGQKLVIDASGHVTHDFRNGALANFLEGESRTALLERSSRNVRTKDGLEAFIEVVTPEVRLLIFGAGDDAIPLTDLAKHLGWHVTVFDGRAHYARREKFPNAGEVLVRETAEAAASAGIDHWTAAVLMSHSYSQDLAALRKLASRDLRYLGILGPRKRTEQLIGEIGPDVSRLGPALHSPMGLDIGADGPEQVALAVVAEIQAVLNGRTGGALRERGGSIHSREEGFPEEEQVWVQLSCV
ncbi:MAG: XdhC family protein [Acidobacteriaceae bacterium]|nr:XdhC family protein [Acidobacteriaceae bacterium]MBV9781298.1 XdhC family protein [Acidobacteriaceae bacterium]